MIEKISHAARIAAQASHDQPPARKDSVVPYPSATPTAGPVTSAVRVTPATASGATLGTTDATGQSVVAARTAQSEVAGKDISQMKALAEAYRAIAEQRKVIDSVAFPAPEVQILPTKA